MEKYNRFFKATLGAVVVLGSASCLNDPGPKTTQTTGTTTGTTVDSDYVGGYPSLAVGPDGRLHAIYYAKRDWSVSGGGALRHAVLENDVWSSETIDGNISDPAIDVGRYTSVAADAVGGLHVAYWDVMNGALKYATLPSMSAPGPWQFETVQSPRAVCQDADLKIDPSTGNINIAYCDSSQILLVTKDSSGWSVPEVIAPLSGTDLRAKVSIRFDALGNLYAVFFDPVSKKIQYTMRDSGGYQPVEDVASLQNNETRMGMTLDGSDIPHVVFYDIFEGTLQHTYRIGASSWSVPNLIASVGNVTYSIGGSSPTPGILQLSSLIDHLGRLRISYYRGVGAPSGFGGPGLRNAVLRNSDWLVLETDTIEEGDIGWTSAMVESNSGTIHIVYRDNVNNDLKYYHF